MPIAYADSRVIFCIGTCIVSQGVKVGIVQINPISGVVVAIVADEPVSVTVGLDGDAAGRAVAGTGIGLYEISGCAGKKDAGIGILGAEIILDYMVAAYAEKDAAIVSIVSAALQPTAAVVFYSTQGGGCD